MSDYTPTTEEVETHWVNVGFAGDRASFRRWLAKNDAEVAATVRKEAAADVESSKPVQDGSEYRQWMAAGIDRALFRIRSTEYRKTETEGK